jgi:hypothetical protein
VENSNIIDKKTFTLPEVVDVTKDSNIMFIKQQRFMIRTLILGPTATVTM